MMCHMMKYRNMFGKILVIYSEKLAEKHLKTVDKVKNLLKGRNFSIIKSHELREDNFKDVDLAITII